MSAINRAQCHLPGPSFIWKLEKCQLLLLTACQYIFLLQSVVLISCLIEQNCLSLIYTVHVDGLSVPLETVIGNLLTCVIPIAGGSQVIIEHFHLSHRYLCLQRNFTVSTLNMKALFNPDFILHSYFFCNLMAFFFSAIAFVQLLCQALGALFNRSSTVVFQSQTVKQIFQFLDGKIRQLIITVQCWHFCAIAVFAMNLLGNSHVKYSWNKAIDIAVNIIKMVFYH